MASNAPPSAAPPAPPPPPAPVVTVADNMKKMNNFDVWIQDCLMRLYIQPKHQVAEFHCSTGVGLSRLMVDLLSSAPPLSGVNAFQIRHYLGVDLDTSSAKNRWIVKDMPFSADFRDLDVTQCSLLASNITPSSYDHVFCFRGLSRMCSHRTSLQAVLRHTSELLKKDGLFLGTIIDPSVVWYKICKKERESGGKVIKFEKGEGVVYFGPGYKLDFPFLPRSNAPFEPFSTSMKFYFQLLEPNNTPSKAFPPMSSYLLHAPTLVAEAKEMGFELVHMQNCMEFYQEYGSLDAFNETFNKLHILNKHATQLSPAQTDLFSLYTTFAFRKVSEPPPRTTEPSMTGASTSPADVSSSPVPMEL